MAEPTGDWITNGGTLWNQRYSPLTQIDTSNVSRLKGVWRTRLGSGTAAKYSAEAQPIVYGGVMYIATGADDVVALDVATGDFRWQYQAHLDQKISTVCCGWTSRGVALGDGRVFIGQLDGKLVALDQDTGKVDWSTQVVRWQKGQTITAAPLYYDGKVITGVSGGDLGARGRVTAFDAKSGKEVWRFWTVPGPGEVGHDTWPRGTEAWKHGGAPVWQTPAVDPELGLMYFSTGNAAPDLDGSARAGDNLFASSIVAVDPKTGKHRWHFQQVHHDIWDCDSPSPVVLFDVTVGERVRHALAEASKTGWLYMLDRETGKPLYGIDEKPVPQSAAQKTSPTQPIPRTPAFVPHVVSASGYRHVVQAARQQAKGKGEPPPVRRATQVYTPPGPVTTVMTPGPSGGTNWPPTSYSAKTQMLYVCAACSAAGYKHDRSQTFKEGSYYIGSVLTTVGFGAAPGRFTAIDARSGRVVWQKSWPEACYSGSTTTAGNLVLVGRSGGQLQAYDGRDGKLLWSFQTGAGANSTATVFERDGKEYIAFYAGGNSLAASPHGDNVWLFGLDGTLGPAAAGGAGAGTGHGGEGGAAPTAAGDVAAGRTVFADNCSGCHGATGHGGDGGPDLTSIPSAKRLARVQAQVTNEGGGMPAFRGSLSPKEIGDVSAYVVKRITNP